MRVIIDDEIVIRTGHTAVWSSDQYTVTATVSGLTEKGDEITATLIMSRDELALLASEV